MEAGKPRFLEVAEVVKAVILRFCEPAGPFYGGSHMTDMVDEHDEPLPPATLTPREYDRLAAEVRDDLDRVAAKLPRLETRHRATANARRAHLTVPQPFSTAICPHRQITRLGLS